MGKFNVGDRVYSSKWRATGVVAEPPSEEKDAFNLFENLFEKAAVYVVHDENSPEMAGTAGLYFEEELQHA